MKRETINKAKDLIDEIEKLERYKDLIDPDEEDRYNAHFEFVQHHGEVRDYEKVVISAKHNTLFIEVLDKIIKQLEEELEKL